MPRRPVSAGLVGLCLASVLWPAPAAAAPSSDLEGWFTDDDVAIRAEPRLSARIHGRGYRDHKVTLHCYTVGDDVDGIKDWLKLTDRTTNVRGFSSAKYVSFDWHHEAPSKC
jgi:hypothetical protein